MPKLIEMKLGENRTIMIEAAEDYDVVESYRGDRESIVEKVDKAFDELVQNEIVEHCKVLVGAFEELKKLPNPPTSASVNFGLQFSGSGNVFVVKVASQASIAVSINWEI